MKTCNPLERRCTQRILHIACAMTLAAASTASLAHGGHSDHGDEITPPPVPANIQVLGQRVFFVGHAVGTQNYICLPSGTTFKYTLFTPQATLFNDAEKEVTTHYFSPNPDEPATPIRATWQHSRDTSTVWGKVPDGDSSTDANFVKPGAIAWLRVTVVGREEGPNGGDALYKTNFIQRLNTSGGLAPPTGCASAADVGRQAFMPYTADYFFYTDR